jgi:NADPH-dependent curcumin reductase
MADQNRRFILAERPAGSVEESTMRLERGPVPEPGPGQALAQVRFLSIDPAIRVWLDDLPSDLPPIAIGEVIRGLGVAEIVRSDCDGYEPGDLTLGLTGWQDYVLVDKGEHSMLRTLAPGLAPETALGVLGVNGMTAYFGMLDVGRVTEGDVVVVSGAAGATGSIAGQIARVKGAAKVIGVAGGPEKCTWLVEELGFTAAIDYKADDVSSRLAELAPAGIDLFFDNVGGEILDACLANLSERARVVLCGAISVYNSRATAGGPANYMMLIFRNARMEGFEITNYFDRFEAAQAELGAWLESGAIDSAEQIVDGLERAPGALNLLFTGGNTGKLVVRT